MTALGSLTRRSVLDTLRDGDLIFAIGGPVAFFVCFNITLRNVIDTGGMTAMCVLQQTGLPQSP